MRLAWLRNKTVRGSYVEVPGRCEQVDAALQDSRSTSQGAERILTGRMEGDTECKKLSVSLGGTAKDSRARGDRVHHVRRCARRVGPSIARAAERGATPEGWKRARSRSTADHGCTRGFERVRSTTKSVTAR